MSDRVVAYVSDQAHSSLARARAAARLPARPGPRAPDRRRAPAPPDDRSRARSRPTSRAGRAPLFVVGQRRRDEHRRGRPAAGTRGVCREHGVWLHVDARVRRVRRADRARSRRALRGIELRRLDHARPAQVALPAVSSAAALLVREGAAAAARVRDRCPTTSATPRSHEGEVNFADLGTAADAAARGRSRSGSRSSTSGSTRSGRRSTAASTSPSSRARRIEASADARADGAAVARHRLLPAPLRRRRGRGRRALQRRARRRARGERARRSSPPRGCTAGTRSGCACSATRRDRGGRRARARRSSSAPSVAPADPRPQLERDAEHRGRWRASRRGRAPDELRALPLFDALTETEAERRRPRRGSCEPAAGEKIVSQWDAARDFYVSSRGTASVFVDGDGVARAGARRVLRRARRARLGRRLRAIPASPPSSRRRRRGWWLHRRGHECHRPAVPRGRPRDQDGRPRAARPGAPLGVTIAAVIDPLERWREHGEKPDYAGLLTFGGAAVHAGPGRARRASTSRSSARRRDDLVSDRPGARFGPRAIRAASCPPGPHLEAKVDAFAELRVVDFGDAPVLPADAERSHAGDRGDRRPGARRRRGADRARRRPLDRRARHPRVRGAHGPVGLVHFDTHTDTGTEVFGVEVSHGTPMYRLVEAGHVDPGRYVQIGLRGYWPGEEEFEWQARARDHELLHARRPRARDRGGRRADARARRRRAGVPLGRRRRARPGVRAGHGHARAGRHDDGRPALGVPHGRGASSSSSAPTSSR